MFDCGESLSHSDRVKEKKQYWRKLLSLFLYPHTISSQLSDVAGLHSLMPNSLSALAGSLKHLVLSNNKLQAVPTYALRQLRELDHINLNQNNISVIKEGAFWGLSKVRDPLPPLHRARSIFALQVTRLTLYDNKISVIRPDAFDGLTK